MNTKNTYKTVLLIILVTILVSCNAKTSNQKQQKVNSTENFEREKKAILDRLNNETKDAFERNYEAWTQNWVHDPDISKTYLNFHENTFSESLGWDEISNFVKNYIEEHPKPEPLPEPLKDIDIRLYENAAWVTYKQRDNVRGLKRETRLMEKKDGKWKIAGMSTTIYGFETENQ